MNHIVSATEFGTISWVHGAIHPIDHTSGIYELVHIGGNQFLPETRSPKAIVRAEPKNPVPEIEEISPSLNIHLILASVHSYYGCSYSHYSDSITPPTIKFNNASSYAEGHCTVCLQSSQEDKATIEHKGSILNGN